MARVAPEGRPVRAVARGPLGLAEAPGAYAAVHVVRGDFTPPNESVERFGRWLHCADDTSPVIAEVASKSAGQTFEAFRRAVLARPVATAGPTLSYTSLKGDRFTFFIDQSAPPLINGNP